MSEREVLLSARELREACDKAAARIVELVREREQLAALIHEAYEGEPPTNHWRRQAEALVGLPDGERETP